MKENDQIATEADREDHDRPATVTLSDDWSTRCTSIAAILTEHAC